MQRMKCLAQGHKAVSLVRLEPATPKSRFKNSTTEPPLSGRVLDSRLKGCGFEALQAYKINLTGLQSLYLCFNIM